MWLVNGVFWLVMVVLGVLALDALTSKLWDAVFDKPFWFVMGTIARVLELFVKPEPKPPSEPSLVLPDDMNEYEEITTSIMARGNHDYDELDEYYTKRLDAIFTRAKIAAASRPSSH